jgi:LEA14-like dessication related protein
MSRTKLLQVLLAVVAVLVFSGCSKPKPPTLTPEATRVVSVTAQGIGIRVTLAALNPNDFDLNTQKVVGTIKLGDKVTLGPISKPHGIKLEANKSTNIDLDIEASWEQAAQLAQLATVGPNVPYEVEGTVTVGGKSLNVDLPFKIKGDVSQTQLIAAGLKGLPAIPGLPGFK